jgi:sulfotransferase
VPTTKRLENILENSPEPIFNHMERIYHFLNGMPRSGSTLLANILNQNPRFWASPTSGICPLMLQVNAAWPTIPELRASSSPAVKSSVLLSMLHGAYLWQDRPVIIDKSRGWVCAFEMLENILGRKPRLLVTVRDLPSILASCEKLFRRELANSESTARFGSNMETIEGRLAHWTSADQLVGGTYNRIRDCVRRGHRASMHFVDFDDLTNNPNQTMRAIYDFLEEEPFEHDFFNVEQTTHEKDSEHGFCDLHTIRRTVMPMKLDYKEILGDAARPYLGFDYDFTK